MSIATAARERLTGVFAESVYDNPVLVMGFRTRMRRATAFVVLGGYALFLAVVMLIAYYALWESMKYRGMGSPMSNRSIGSALFYSITWTQVALFTLIVPALSGGALTMEMDRRTMEMLSLTPLSAGKIALGKHLSAFIYCVALLLCSLPLSGMCLMFGGISPAEIAVTYLHLITWCFLLSALGVFWSSLFTTTAPAQLFTYGSSLVYFVGTLTMGGALIASVLYGHSGSNIVAVSALNPGWVAYVAMMTAKVCGISVPVALPPIILHTAIGILLLLCATTHVRFHRAQRPLSIRLLLLGITAVLTWLIAGNMISTSIASTGRYYLEILEFWSIVILIVMCLWACIFATGPLRKDPKASIFTYILSPHKAFTNNLRGATGFMLLWLAVVYAVFGISVYWAAKAAGLSIGHLFWANYFRIGVSSLAVMMGVCALGIFWSSISQVRALAVLLMALFTLLILAGYLMVLSYHFWGYQKGNSALYQLAAFWPLTPILSATSWKQDWPKLWWSLKDSWLVTGGVYLLITVVCLGLASVSSAKWGGIKED
ncbi:MAG: hypothetical protein Q7N50_11800 [Armatimonadota bacterium]|nr:hypothetical protein [Armatimonadota bacterium]